MAVRKSGDRWVVEFMFRGVRVFRRLPVGVGKQEAQALESKLRAEIFNAVDLGKLPDPPLVGVIDEWIKSGVGKKSYKATRSHANQVGAIAKGVGLSAIPTVANDVRALGEGGLSSGTVNRRLCVLKAVAKYAYQKGYIRENLSGKIQLLPEKGYTRREVTPEQVEAVIRAASTPRARALIAFAAYTGMRLGEIVKLKPANVLGGSIRVLDAKNGEDREVPILPQLKPHLKALPFDANWRNVYRGWERARKAAGVGMRFHDLRHFAATQMANAGVNPLVMADILGHKSLQTTRKYTHPSLKAKADALKAITSGLQQTRKKKARKRAS